MRRIQYHRYGGPEEMLLEEVKLPKPGRGQVRVQLVAGPCVGSPRRCVLALQLLSPYLFA